MTRIAALTIEQMSADQKQVYDTIAAGPRGRVRGPLAIWLNRPKLAATAQALGQYCRYDSCLPPRLSEFAILIMAVHWKAEFEWWAHKPAALKAGLSPDIVNALRDGAPITFTQTDEAAVHEVMIQLHADRRLKDDVYQRALDVLGQDQLVDLIGLAGYYTLVSMTLNAFDVGLPDGEAPELDNRASQSERQ